MALTVILDAHPDRPEAGLTLTVEGPRIVIGRGAGCEILLPDPTVSARHATIRREGAKTIVIDEGSMNGTQVGTVRLPAQTPRAVRSGDWLRIGRVWLQVEFGAGVPSTVAEAQSVAMAFMARRLADRGEPAAPSIGVPAGNDAGKTLVLSDPQREYIIGTADDADLILSDPNLSRRHAGIARQGVDMMVRALGSQTDTELGGRLVGSESVPWPEGQALAVGKTLLQLDDPVIQALEEVLASGDLRMRPAELREPPPRCAAEEVVVDAPADPLVSDIDDDEFTPEPEFEYALEHEEGDSGGLGIDLLVALLALGLLALSIAAMVVLFGR